MVLEVGPVEAEVSRWGKTYSGHLGQVRMQKMATLTVVTGLLLLSGVAISSRRHHGRRDHLHHHHYDQRARHNSRNVCYPGIGCFNSGYPFNNTGEVPQDPDFINTAFTLYTRQRLINPSRLEAGSRLSLIQSSFNRNHSVKVLIHGFLATTAVPWIRNLTREFLRKEPMNVITVNWAGGAGFPYVQAAANTRLVGAQIASLVTFLAHETGSSLEQYHLIGHSLGAHVAGYAGHRVPGIGRITGLDPAQPDFQGQPPMVRLDPTDAAFVDVIHTDGSPYDTLGGFGMIDPVGHLDFYPNGGIQQPGCAQDGWSSFVSSAYSSGVEEAEFTVGCNHNRASALFVESVNSHCPFTAYPCPDYDDFTSGNCFNCDVTSCPSMGYSALGSASRGSFYLKTNPHPPFCGYHYEVTVSLGHDMRRTRGVMRARLHGNHRQIHVIHLYSGILNPGEVVSVVFVSASDVGDVEDVHVTFERVYSYMDYLGFWNTNNDVLIQRLTTFSVTHNQRKVFCPSEEVVRDGSGVWLTRGVTEAGSTC